MTETQTLAAFESGEFATGSVRDRSATADIRAAVAMRQAAQGMVDAAVEAARSEGLTWVEVGLALGISPQGARQKYARHGHLVSA
ncbi:MAG: hypothetical protein LBH13_05375 [Cellulomonadaceae bacterium]|nr:hypothetical protein [Cellulomonadaceae bacterium]